METSGTEQDLSGWVSVDETNQQIELDLSLLNEGLVIPRLTLAGSLIDFPSVIPVTLSIQIIVQQFDCVTINEVQNYTIGDEPKFIE